MQTLHVLHTAFTTFMFLYQKLLTNLRLVILKRCCKVSIFLMEQFLVFKQGLGFMLVLLLPIHAQFVGQKQ